MLFNSLIFWLFFALVYLAYRVLDHKGQNRLLLIASMIFYGAWDFRFLTLIWISVFVDYFVSHQIHKSTQTTKKRILLSMSILVNLSILGFFKYFNFFADSFTVVLGWLGFYADPITLHIILPLGISFYTFQTMGYTIDVYRGKNQPESNFWDFALYVCFFPQLVAGPIERASILLPQIKSPRDVTGANSLEGMGLILRGLVKKVVIADNLAIFVDAVFDPALSFPGHVTLLGIYGFAIQIYCDFSGYTDMARGIAKLLGFELSLNFRWPYLSKSPSEFWQRWHISLSSWLRDYLYIPLGGNRFDNAQTLRNLLMTMLLGGLWHGASWMFVLWGFYHGLLLIAERVMAPFLTKLTKKPQAELFRTVIMFHLTCVGWIFFRAESVPQVFSLGTQLFSLGTLVAVFIGLAALALYRSLFINSEQPRWKVQDWALPWRFCVFGLYGLLILGFGVTHATQFIYFQF